MRTKTLLSVAAALAVGAIWAQAQVYSVNVVGYVNKVLPANTFVAASNPLDDGTNTLNSILGGLENKSSAQFWNGTGFDVYSKKSGAWPALSVPVGQGFFVKAAGVAGDTNTFVGELIVGPGESYTNTIPFNTFVMVGCSVPYAGDLNDTNINLTPLNKSSVQLWNGTGFDVIARKSGAWDTNAGITVAEGFFLKTAGTVNYDWVQTVPSN